MSRGEKWAWFTSVAALIMCVCGVLSGSQFMLLITFVCLVSVIVGICGIGTS